jgi:hypothetical protein
MLAKAKDQSGVNLGQHVITGFVFLPRPISELFLLIHSNSSQIGKPLTLDFLAA